ncbi:MAG: (d)CMP kinase, partial [Clostridia bacterium]|nr:(d)CMP kinase [Clostridia bacterium]
MKAIRGATTVSADKPELIKQCVKELLNEIVNVNNLDSAQIICIMFSNTSDLHSFYPAKAAREAGFSSCALYSSLEPEIDGALKKCIRVMMLVESDIAPSHVYLNEAKNLRKDITSVLNIAVDGPAGSGKSTVSKLVAQKLGILYLDTGAMYRAVAYKCVKENKDYGDKDVVKHIINKLDLKVEYCDGKQITKLDGEDISEKIRTPQVSMLASYVSAYSFVRTKMVALQREIAQKTSCILDGRDIGTNVLPNCKFKFFLTASAEVRAKRRYDEDKAKGTVQSFEDVLKEINTRDFQDKNRAVAPLK